MLILSTSIAFNFKQNGFSFSVLWPTRNVQKGDECTRDFLFGIGEDKQRSARLTAWFHTPQNYFIQASLCNLLIYTRMTFIVLLGVFVVVFCERNTFSFLNSCLLKSR